MVLTDKDIEYKDKMTPILESIKIKGKVDPDKREYFLSSDHFRVMRHDDDFIEDFF